MARSKPALIDEVFDAWACEADEHWPGVCSSISTGLAPAPSIMVLVPVGGERWNRGNRTHYFLYSGNVMTEVMNQ